MKKIMFFLKNYSDYSKIFSEYTKLFKENNFEVKIFDFTKTYLRKGKLNYAISIIKEIINFRPDFVYVGDEFFSKNVFFITLLKKFLFYKYKMSSLAASQYIFGKRKNFLIKNIDVLFCRNKKELEKIGSMDLFKNYRSKLHKIYLGVPEEFFHKINEPREIICNYFLPLKNNYHNIKDKYVLGFFGRVSPEKGLHIILECLKKLPDNFVLVSASRRDSSDYQANIQNFIKENNLEKRVIWISDVKEQDLKYVYNICDLAIMPTTKKFNNFQELFGSVIAESMFCQTLIVGSDNGSIPEIIGRPDLIFKQDDVSDLLKVIDYVYNLKSEEKQKIINENHNLASKEYSAEAFVNTIIKAAFP